MCVWQLIFEVGLFMVKILKLQTRPIPSALLLNSYFVAVVRQGRQKCVGDFRNTQKSVEWDGAPRCSRFFGWNAVGSQKAFPVALASKERDQMLPIFVAIWEKAYQSKCNSALTLCINCFFICRLSVHGIFEVSKKKKKSRGCESKSWWILLFEGLQDLCALCTVSEQGNRSNTTSTCNNFCLHGASNTCKGTNSDSAMWFHRNSTENFHISV